MAAKQTSTTQEAWDKWKLDVRKQLVLKLPLRGSLKTILIGILDCLRGESWCWPSDQWLADFAGCSRRHAQRCRAILSEQGLIETDERFERFTGRQQSSRCRIIWQRVGVLTRSAPMAAWKKPPQLRTRPNVTLPTTFKRPNVTLPATYPSPLESNRTKGNEKNPPTPPGWQKALAVVGQVLKDQETRDRASSEARRHGLSSDDVLALVAFYVANASAFRSAGVLAYVLRNAPAGCAANPGEHFPVAASLPPNAVTKSAEEKRRAFEADTMRLQRLTPSEVRRIVTQAAVADGRWRPLVEQFERERWLGFPKEVHRSLLLAGIREGLLEGVPA